MEDQENNISYRSSKISSPIKSLTVLVVDDDTTCLSIVAAFLKSLKYQVVTVKHPNDALNTLKIKGSSFDLVITDVHMPDMNGFELQKQIDQEFKLPVVFMSADDQDGVIVKGLQNGASFFIVKPVSPNDLKNLWQYAFANKKGKAIVEEIESTQQTHKPGKHCSKDNGNTVVPETTFSIDKDNSNEGKERKRKVPMKEDIKDAFANVVPKKTKFVWTSSLHNQFLEAIRSIGLDKAGPKKILETMNVNGLTREHVASHLQKYRQFVKKVTETSSRIQLDQLQSASEPELPSDFLLRKQSVEGYFPISKSPKLGLSSSFNHRHPFSSNSTLGSGSDIMSLLYHRNNSKQPTFEISNSFYDTNSSVYGNKPNVPFYGNFSKGVVIGQEKPRLAPIGINRGLNINMLGSEKIESFNYQKLNLDPNFEGLAKLGTSENNGLEGSTGFVFENGLINGIGNEIMSTVPDLGGTSGDAIPKSGISSSNNENQLTNKLAYQYLNNDNNVGENVEIFRPLDDLSDSRNSCFLQQFGDQVDASFTWKNQTNTQSQTQQSGVGEELIPNFGIAGSPSSDQIFQSFEQNYFQFDEEEFLQSLFGPGTDGRDRQHGTF